MGAMRPGSGRTTVSDASDSEQGADGVETEPDPADVFDQRHAGEPVARHTWMSRCARSSGDAV
jgi:hypothetical protein